MRSCRSRKRTPSTTTTRWCAPAKSASSGKCWPVRRPRWHIPAEIPVANRADAPADRSLARGQLDYPAALLELADPPEILFVRGRWPIDGATVAMVGSRAASEYGLQFAERLSAELARLGSTIVSGLAQGIDAASHRGALAAGGS